MAHFYGTVEGSNGKASRLGSAGSGIVVQAASYSGGIEVRLFNQDGVDKFVVKHIYWEGEGVSRIIAEGEVGE